MAFPRHGPLEPLAGDIFGKRDFADIMKLRILEVMRQTAQAEMVLAAAGLEFGSRYTQGRRKEPTLSVYPLTSA